ncbi:hypothetical protein COL26b_011224 [Colletotrichum chrysophilum]|uniref:Uncharacterized protein n=1 Tax=Colletotrichum chrysophilum TaxID=1836956 RepID=A0AAD9AT12_9PEZI|nr:uncharacterized protein COL26b_011224 [Colletotrichum chrysophilum]KAJ0346050.1 hypothetical protein KNSL1_007848 [Colletotrichum chrysophilum]KAJ0367621.1 hypothetical protein COL26b_011224 [Colletotrichum chrysophilum]KAK1852935.1 hypothetical protein CCHR01_04476 [Colletotrichum chrysophilum]
MSQFTAPAVSISLPPNFTYAESVSLQEGAIPNTDGVPAPNGTNGSDHSNGTNGSAANLEPPASNLRAPPLKVLQHFKGTFKGHGFNTIFRPNNNKAGFSEMNVKPNDDVKDNILQLNITAETQVFSTPLGAVPNRGLDDQPDIALDGISYTQTIIDLTEKVKGRQQPVIHFEPGLWMRVPKTEDPTLAASYSRMASIPHGTTINAQCFDQAVITNGAPNIDTAGITPFLIRADETQAKSFIPFASQQATDSTTHRLPQDLEPFIKNSSITQEMIDNPNSILTKANKGKTITNTTTFTVSTDSQPGGGTRNIGFLVSGKAPGTGGPSNADAVSMSATYWVSTVQAKVELKPWKPTAQKPFRTFSPAAHSRHDGVPTFVVRDEIKTARTVTVEYTQIQYSQTVMLNFAKLSWPHVSVATLAPSDIPLVEAIIARN